MKFQIQAKVRLNNIKELTKISKAKLKK